MRSRSGNSIKPRWARERVYFSMPSFRLWSAHMIRKVHIYTHYTHTHSFFYPPHHHQHQHKYHLVRINIMVMQTRRTGKLHKQQQNCLLFILIFIEFIDMLWLLSVFFSFFLHALVYDVDIQGNSLKVCMCFFFEIS